jgi:hypothetical protein
MADRIQPTITTSTEIAGIFYMSQSCDMGQTAYRMPEKSDGFGRV